MALLDLGPALDLVEEADTLLKPLDGVDLDERPSARNSEPPAGMSKAKARELRLTQSRNLQLAAQKLTLAAELVREQYWIARTGDTDD